MARYLLIEFDENDHADALRAQINAATEKGRPFRVVGLFARPGKNCRCASTRAQFMERLKTHRAERGIRFGWWTCPGCNKPRFGGHILNNLMKMDEVIEPSHFTEVELLSAEMRPKPYRYVVDNIRIGVFPHREAK